MTKLTFEGNVNMEKLTFEEYQKLARTTALFMEGIEKKYKDTLPEELHRLIALTYTACGLGEAGEIQGKIKKIIRDNAGEITIEHIQALKGELGDLLYYIAATCDVLGLTLEEVARANNVKLKDRWERGVIKGSGDKR